MSIQIKICGLTEEQAVDAAVSAGADLIGFVFFPPSPRNISVHDAAKLSQEIPAHIRKVGVFVDAGDAMIREAVEGVPLDMVQMHGSESPQRIADIKARFRVPVVKATAVSNEADIVLSEVYEGIADHLLFDAKAPDDLQDALPGGNGTVFDWNLISAADPAPGWMLSGGLTPDNVDAAIKMTGALGVDVSSGIEKCPGVKDPAKIVAFITAVRQAREPRENLENLL